MMVGGTVQYTLLFAIFSIRDKGMEEKLQCHKDVTFGLQGRKYI